jgi:hypothetical protein
MPAAYRLVAAATKTLFSSLVGRRLFLAGHEAVSHHPAHTFTDGSSQCEWLHL